MKNPEIILKPSDKLFAHAEADKFRLLAEAMQKEGRYEALPARRTATAIHDYARLNGLGYDESSTEILKMAFQLYWDVI